MAPFIMSNLNSAGGLPALNPRRDGFKPAGAMMPRTIGEPLGRTVVRQVTQLCDGAAIIASYVLSYYLHDVAFRGWYPPIVGFSGYLWMLWLILPFWLYAMSRARMYEADCYRSFAVLYKRLAKAHAIAAMLLLSFLFASHSWNVSRLFTQIFIAVNFLALGAERSALKLLTDRTSLSFIAHLPRVLVIGDGPQVDSYVRFIRKHSWLVREIIGSLAVHGRSQKAQTCPSLGTAKDLAAILNEKIIDEVVIASPQLVNDDELTGICLVRGVTLRFVLQAPATSVGTSSAEDLGEGFYQLSIATACGDFPQLVIKRLMDLIGALVGLPACAVAALWYWPRLRRESPGPLFFRQTRVGQNGRPFTLYKFRTMHLDAAQRLSELACYNEMKGHVFKMRDDPRVLPTGKTLRRFHLDELPQFWNVLKGDMSLVGTRPPTLDEVRRYDLHHHRRISTKPGMTGLSQLAAGPSLMDFEHIVRLDCKYIDHWSILLDIKVLLRTVVKVLSGNSC